MARLDEKMMTVMNGKSCGTTRLTKTWDWLFLYFIFVVLLYEDGEKYNPKKSTFVFLVNDLIV